MLGLAEGSQARAWLPLLLAHGSVSKALVACILECLLYVIVPGGSGGRFKGNLLVSFCGSSSSGGLLLTK